MSLGKGRAEHRGDNLGAVNWGDKKLGQRPGGRSSAPRTRGRRKISEKGWGEETASGFWGRRGSQRTTLDQVGMKKGESFISKCGGRHPEPNRWEGEPKGWNFLTRKTGGDWAQGKIALETE